MAMRQALQMFHPVLTHMLKCMWFEMILLDASQNKKNQHKRANDEKKQWNFYSNTSKQTSVTYFSMATRKKDREKKRDWEEKKNW